MSAGEDRSVRKRVLPGDALAVIEEALARGDFYVDEQGNIRAKKAAEAELDPREKSLVVSGVPMSSEPPKAGDQVIGVVEYGVSEDMFRMTVIKVNGRDSTAGFGVILLAEARRREGPGITPNDIVRAKVIGSLNGIAFASISCEKCGVIWTRCSRCGGNVARIRDNLVKCLRCGNREYRRLAPDFMSASAIA